ncbi:hypothetical protein M6B38_361860 [Iris pallida]|uniref:Uncharacterized protein n=1 Tax=Iris pallida TaxID=29817 RepID=A0AAX6GK15_IRIPA|nr:hypothetical protein M6B38_361860 [Iris pallida]
MRVLDWFCPARVRVLLCLYRRVNLASAVLLIDFYFGSYLWVVYSFILISVCVGVNLNVYIFLEFGWELMSLILMYI